MRDRLFTNWAILLLLGCISLTLPWAAPTLYAQGPAPQATGWSEPVSLSANFPQSYLPDIAADQAGNLYVVWDVVYEARDDGWGEGIGFAMWDGVSWSPGVDIFSGEITHLPSIVADSQGRLHLMGVTYVGGGIIPQHSELRYSRAWAQQRPVDAQSWSTPVDPAPEYAVYWNDMVVDSRDWIHVVFAGWDPYVSPVIADGQCTGEGCSRVYYIRSTDGGDSWSAPLAISPPMASGARVMIAADHQDGLYVVWSTEWYAQGSDFVPSANGFVYSPDGGDRWGEPETQLFDTSGDLQSPTNYPRDYWLSVAVDSQRTVHIVATGSGIRHVYRQGASGPWIESTVRPLDAAGLAPGYGFRGTVVDSNDTLHLILPTWNPTGSQTPAGLFHIAWDRVNGWSHWKRATTNTRGRGCGFGNLAISGGNNLNVVWFEHLEGSAGHLFVTPRGRSEIYYARFQTGSESTPLLALPPMPTPTAEALMAWPTSISLPTASAAPLLAASPTVSAGIAPESSSVPVSGPVMGIGAAAIVLAVAVLVVLWQRSR